MIVDYKVHKYIIGVKVDRAVHQMRLVAVRSVPAYGTHGKPNLL